MIAIYKKELRAYFNSMIGWMFLAFMFLGVGFYHVMINLLQGYGLFTYALSGVMICYPDCADFYHANYGRREPPEDGSVALYVAGIDCTDCTW